MLELFGLIGAIELLMPLTPVDEKPSSALVVVAAAAEVLDPGEFGTSEKYIGTSWVKDNEIRKRLVESATYPYIEACRWFPSRDTAVAAWKFNRDYCGYLEKILETYCLSPTQHERVYEVLKETRFLGECWELLSDIQNEFYFVMRRRQKLAELREKIGADNFYRGIMPPHVPYHAFFVEP